MTTQEKTNRKVVLGAYYGIRFFYNSTFHSTNYDGLESSNDRVDLYKSFLPWKTDAVSIYVFSSRLDQEVVGISECALLITTESSVSKDSTEFVDLKFCIDSKWMEPKLYLSLTERVNDGDSRIEKALQWFVELNTEEFRYSCSLEATDRMVKYELKSKWKTDTLFQEAFFIKYNYSSTSWPQNGYSMVSREVIVCHVLSAIQPPG